MRLAQAKTTLFTLLLLGLPVLKGAPTAGVTLTVDTALDADAVDGFCSLREAILAANADGAHNECAAGSGADRIVFALALPTAIDVLSDLPPVTATLAIRGPGSDLLGIDGQDLHRLFYFLSPAGGAWYLLEDLSVQHGLADDALGDHGGGVYVGPGDTVVLSRVVVGDNTAANGGGGIAVDGVVGLPAAAEIDQSIVIGNRALGASGGGGLMVVDGSTATVLASSVVANSAEALHGNGGGILVQRSVLVLERSTVSGNSAYDGGGGISISGGLADAAMTVVDSTISVNIADADVDLHGDGGGIDTIGTPSFSLTIEMENSIVAENYDDGTTVYPDLAIDPPVVVTSHGFNLVGANDGGAVPFPSGSPNANGDFVGTAAAAIDPMLQTLALNQGITLSHRPFLDPASPVIDHGACAGRVGDQRGHGAPALHQRAIDHPAVPNHAASDGCDIGSVERGALPNSAAELFFDGFELGHTLRWSTEVL